MNPSIHAQERIGPVPLSERIQELDVVRGLALFGILASNMRAFNGPMAAYFDHSLMWQDWPNRVVQMFVDLFISGKFITIFSFLFGVGFAVQMDRARDKGLAGRGFYLRRIGILFLMGVAHMWLLWWGDILTVYALMGLFLFLFRNRSQKTILWWAAILYSWPWVIGAGFYLASLAGAAMPAPPVPGPQELQRLIQVHATGGYAEIFRERVKDNQTAMAFIAFYSPRLLGLFLFGLWVWRRGIIQNLAAHQELLRRCQWWGLITGLPLNVAMVAIQEIWHPSPARPDAAGFIHGVIGGLAMPALSLFYASTVVLLFQRREWMEKLQPFGAVGRTALTNYLMQTVICTLLYYGYGLGLYGKVGPLAGLLVTALIYASQVSMSVWWLQRFRFGPMEWLWRTLTYGKMPVSGGRP